MGIWIRSQDKEKLIKCEDIQISGTDIVNFTRYGVVELGKYSTKEKALKVLDEIDDFAAMGCYLYRLPQDDEVE